jgi:kinesin family protein 13
VQEDALSIEVWGHRNDGYGSSSLSTIDLQSLQLNKSLHERWADVTRRLELCIEIRELNDNGHYVPVEVQQLPDVLTGGVYQLRQVQHT